MRNTVIPKVIGQKRDQKNFFSLQNAYFYQTNHLTTHEVKTIDFYFLLWTVLQDFKSFLSNFTFLLSLLLSLLLLLSFLLSLLLFVLSISFNYVFLF